MNRSDHRGRPGRTFDGGGHRADEPSTTDSAHRSLVATSGSLHRYAVLLVEVDDEGLNELSALLEELVEGVDALTAEVAAGRFDLATAVAAEWDAYREQVAEDWETVGG